MSVVMGKDALNAFMKEVFVQVADDFLVEHVDEEGLRIRLYAREKHLRPGGTMSGPAMFGLVDVAAYLITLAHIGPKALAVTTELLH